MGCIWLEFSKLISLPVFFWKTMKWLKIFMIRYLSFSKRRLIAKEKAHLWATAVVMGLSNEGYLATNVKLNVCTHNVS